MFEDTSMFELMSWEMIFLYRTFTPVVAEQYSFLRLDTIEQGSKTLICISFTKLNIHLLLERVFLNFSGYSLTVTQIQANATKRLRQFRNRSHFSRDAKRIYEKTYYSHPSSVVSTVALVFRHVSEVSTRSPLSFALFF
ncbi:hypothetical protein CSKR_105825 [Clonorchis sinensis]|uniref:Uncharacterized protein n=1 Tax=Clonorchis sinensis TaxID=79923 RepID=A0A419PI78_CLOSI|nr:hypothetical protein CSKR_105825 [Clonorchis sinensis]